MGKSEKKNTDSCYSQEKLCCSVTQSNSCTTPQTVACRACLSMGFSSQQHEQVTIYSSVGSSRPRDQTRISTYPALQAGIFFTLSPPGKPQEKLQICNYLLCVFQICVDTGITLVQKDAFIFQEFLSNIAIRIPTKMPT